LKTLQGYVHDRQTTAGLTTLGKHEADSPRLHAIKADAIQQLDKLDQQREGLRPVAPAAVAEGGQ
jgi:hypothetical protein